MKKPYLSIIIVGRNDNYGGNFLERLLNFNNCIYTLNAKYSLNIELIIVEWNPPKDKPKISELIRFPNSQSETYLKIIEVPETIHKKFKNVQRLPLLEYVAKNIGIRRASGDFILSTNPDNLISFDLFKYISKKRLLEKYFYRVDRYDFSGEVNINDSLEKQLSYARKNCFRLNTSGMSVEFKKTNPPFILKLFLAKKWAKTMVKNYPTNLPLPEFILHTNASGDFILMNKNNWFSLKGYPEDTDMIMVDSYLCCMAYAQGLKEKRLNFNKIIFHQDHLRLDRQPTEETYLKWYRDCIFMIYFRKPIITNNNNWGLANMKLKERIFKN